MTLKIALSAAAAMLASTWIVTPANADHYRHGHYYECDDGDWCYDDQWRETRELNLAQLDNLGAGACAVPGYYGPCFAEEDDERFEWRSYRDDPDADDADDDEADEDDDD